MNYGFLTVYTCKNHRFYQNISYNYYIQIPHSLASIRSFFRMNLTRSLSYHLNKTMLLFFASQTHTNLTNQTGTFHTQESICLLNDLQ